MSNTKISSEQIIDGVALGGNPTTTTQSAGNNTTRVATTAFVTTAVANLVDSAPSALNTLNELAAALNDNASFFSTVLPLSGGTMTGDLVLGDNVILEIGAGTGGDLRIFHDGTNSAIQNTTGDLFIYGGTNEIRLRAKDDEESIVVFPNGKVELYFNNSVKLETTTNGISAKGTSSNLITTSSTANDRAGAGFTATESATDGDRRANMYLDADNGAFGTGDSGAYFYIEKKGGGGLVSLIQQDNADLDIQTNGTRRLRVRGDGGVAIGNANDGYSSQIFAVHAGSQDNVLYGQSSDANCFASFRDNSSSSNVTFGAIGNDHVFRNDSTEKARFSGSNLHLNGGTDARIQLGTSGAGATSTSNDTVHIRGDGDNMKLMTAANGAYIFEENGTEHLKIASGGETKITNDASTTFVRSFAGNNSFEPAENLILYNKNGSDGSGANNSVSLGFHVADGATSQGFINYVRSADNAGFFSFSHRTEGSKYREMFSLDNIGARFSGGDASGIQSVFFNNGSFSLADDAVLNTGGINTAAMICILATKGVGGTSYPAALFFALDGGITKIADPEGQFTTTVNTDNKINVYMSSQNFIVQNKIGNTNTMSVIFNHFQGV